MHRTEKVASTVMGAAKVAKATLENVSGVFKQLMREHGEVTALLLRAKATSDVDVRRDLFPKIRQELISHEKGELAVVYPVFREHEDLAAYAEMHQREAGALERMIERLCGIAYEDAAWGPVFTELVKAVSHHVEEEESEYFPLASRTLGKEVAEALRSKYMATKNTIMAENP